MKDTCAVSSTRKHSAPRVQPASTITIAIDSIVFVKALYPRLREDDAAIERYRAAIDFLPPIVIARGRVLVDGFHRLQAYRREGRNSITAIDLGNVTDAEIFNESIRRNARHGLQLSLRDKENLANKLWQTYAHLFNADRTAEIAKLLAVSTKSIERWTKDIRAREKEAQKERAWDMWLDCASEQQIADAIQVHQTTVGEWIKEKRQLPEFLSPPESRQHFDVWQFATADDNAGTPSYFGKLPPQIIENLLWLYTEPGQIVQRQDMTGAERSWASHYEINDVVRYTRGSKAIGIGAGAYASVVAINPAANQLTVEKANQELATYDPRRLTGVSVYREIERQFSVGDRIQFTAPDKSLGVANRELATIETVDPNGRLSAHLVNNRQIDFNPSEHRHFDHGYAVTSHSAQGLTAERVLVHADTGVHPDLLNSRFGYVSISRASHAATLFTDDMAKLAPQLGADVSKTSALDLNPSPSVAQGLGIAI